METYYLIDYENVGGDGLAGCNKLKKTDHIIIFFTQNANKIDMREIADHGEAELRMIEVPAGKQSADIHIGSYLGYLAGVNGGQGCSVVIVSKDKDFDNVAKFWAAAAQIKATRIKQIKASAKSAEANRQEKQQAKQQEKQQEKQQTKQQEKQQTKQQEKQQEKQQTGQQEKQQANQQESPKKTEAKVSGEQKTKLNQDVMQAARAAGFDADIANYVASTVVKNVGEKNGKQRIYRTIISKYGQNKGLNIYNHIKKLI